MGKRFLTAVRGTKPAVTTVTGMSVVIVPALILVNQPVNVGATARFAASANVIGIGVAFVSAQLFAGYLIFNESFQVPQWLGTAFVFVGVVLVAVGHR
jgi:drug/metabolite transporter (DMT)-like permease